MHLPVGESLNALCAGLILICAFAIVGTRQVQGVRRFFISQSILLAAACFLLAWDEHIADLWWLGGITVTAKVILIRWVLKRALAPELYVRREISQAVNIPSSLLLALLLAIGSELLVGPIASATGNPVMEVNLPIGLACVLIGAYSLVARREAIPQLLGILAMENGAFLAGIAIAPTLPSGVALGWAEAPIGPALHWLRLDGSGLVERYRIITASFNNWLGFRVAVEDFAFQDFPIILATFGLSPTECDR